MALDDWPERDKQWAGRYIFCVITKHGVTREASEARQLELIGAVESAGVPAAELFGDPDEVAQADGADLASASVGEIGGARNVLDTVAIVLVLPALAAAILVLIVGIRGDITVGVVVFAAILVVGILAGVAAWASFVDGRIGRAVGFAAVVVLGIAAAVASVAWIDGAILISDAPWWILAPAFFLPSLILVLIARLVPVPSPARGVQHSDEEWFGRFRGTLISRGVARGAATEHERSLRAELVGSAYDEYGEPAAFAREVAADDPAARERRWRWRTSGQGVAAFIVATMVVGLVGGQLLTLVAGVVAAGAAVAWGWRSRPSRVVS